MSDNALLNDILRVGFSRSDYNTVVDPVIPDPKEVDHFFEVQHCVDILLNERLISRENWYPEQIGYFMDLASFVNEHRNLYKISRAVNQAKKNIPLNQYRNNAVIQAYLQYKVADGPNQVTVESQVRALATAMRARNTQWGKLTKGVGQSLCTAMGW
ncbi:hypothetical protein AAE478_000628 [Parahypoxylon ruwenzoriense]